MLLDKRTDWNDDLVLLPAIFAAWSRHIAFNFHTKRAIVGCVDDIYGPVGECTGGSTDRCRSGLIKRRVLASCGRRYILLEDIVVLCEVSAKSLWVVPS